MELDRFPVQLISADGQQILQLTVESADNPDAWATGLMGRDHLETDTGMLFTFDQSEVLSFWMQDTLMPLDILFFDADGKFVSATSMVPCTEEPCPSYQSSGPALYALEVEEGFVERNGVGAGWTLRIH